MLKKIREVWRGLLVPKQEKFTRRKSNRFSKHKFRVHRVGSRKLSSNVNSRSKRTSTSTTRRIDSYHRMTVNVNESTLDKNAKGCDNKNPVSSTTRSLSGHCSTSTTNLFSRCDRETVATTEKPWPDEREIDVTDRTDDLPPKKVVEDTAAECQSTSISFPLPNTDAILQPRRVLLPKNRPKHLHVPVAKKSSQLKVQNLRFASLCHQYLFVFTRLRVCLVSRRK